MKLLLLFVTGVLLLPSEGLKLHAPLNLKMSSVNFKHVLHWTAAPDSPPGLMYHVAAYSGKGAEEKTTTKELWAELKLRNHDVYSLRVKSCLKRHESRCSKNTRISFTPYLDTIITAPNVTMSGCGTCIEVNITLPKPVTEIYQRLGLSYKVSWKQKEEETVETQPFENPTILIPHLFEGTEYCVQVQPYYLEVIFEPSSWRCVFTSTVQQSQVFVIVSSVAAVVVVSLSALVLVLFGLQYTGIICKLKDALPHPLSTSLWQRSLLRLEKTVPEPLSFLPGTGSQQHKHWDQDEEDLETNEEDEKEGQEEDQYMNRGADLSSDSGSRCSRTSSCQSAATVTDPPKSQAEGTEEQKDELAQMIKNEDWMKKESKNCTEIEEWHKELEKYESVNLFSVTTALNPESDQEHCDDQPLVHTHCQSDTDLQQLQESDNEDLETQMNYYMRH